MDQRPQRLPSRSRCQGPILLHRVRLMSVEHGTHTINVRMTAPRGATYSYLAGTRYLIPVVLGGMLRVRWPQRPKVDTYEAASILHAFVSQASLAVPGTPAFLFLPALAYRRGAYSTSTADSKAQHAFPLLHMRRVHTATIK